MNSLFLIKIGLFSVKKYLLSAENYRCKFASRYISGVPAILPVYTDIINDYYLRIKMACKEPYLQDLQVPFTPEPRRS